jgi:hypothetical protein
MKKISVQGLIISLAFSISSTSIAETLRPVIIQNKVDPLLGEVEVPELHTTMMRPIEIPEKSKGILIMFAGLGAKTSNFGIAASTEPLAKKAIKEGFLPLGFQNPLYFHDDLTISERLKIVGNYRSTNEQVNWMVSAIRHAQQATNANEQVPLVIATRSTGSAVFLEAFHRYLNDGSFRDVFARINQVLVMGPVDHRPEAFKAWRALEEDYLSSKSGLKDDLAYDAEPAIFSEMGFASQFVDSRENEPIPKLTFIAGTNDPMVSVENQIGLAKTFQQLHPKSAVHTIVTDTFHNPASGVTYTGEHGLEVKVGTMKRLSPILTQILSEAVQKSSVASGFQLTINDEVKYLFNRCSLELNP